MVPFSDLYTLLLFCIFPRHPIQNHPCKKITLLKNFDLSTLPERRATPCYIDSFQLYIFLQEGTISYVSKSFETLHLRPLGGGTFF